MDMQRIGQFLAQLRKERGLTQEQLAQELGTSNKTISRWETGAYLPPVEMLQLLSEMYGLTINELIAAQRLTPEELPAKAEENLTELIREAATFQLSEQKQYWLDKWHRENRWSMVLLMILFAIAQLIGLWLDETSINAISSILAIGAAVYLRNKRDSYIEHHLYDENLSQN